MARLHQSRLRLEDGSTDRTTPLSRFIAMMRAPAVYVKMLLATAAFCVLCNIHYRSVTTTFFYGIICAVLRQVGYV